MKRRKRSKSKAAEVSAEVQVVPAAPVSLWSGYDGANWSESRGNVFWPSLDSRLALDSFSRDELLRRIHWLKANVGFVKGLVKNSVDLIGWQTPQAQSGDEDWDDQAEEYFRDVTGEAAAFDVAGKFDFESAQLMLMRCALTAGDVLTVLTKWDDGSPRFAFYETHQLANPKSAGKEWRDGIKVSRSGRHLAYGLRTGDGDTVMVVPARDVIYFGEFDNPGEDRPVPPLAHAVNHAVDITEIWGFLKQAIKVSSLFGVVRETEGNSQSRAKQGLTGTPRTVTDSNGNKVRYSDVWDGGQIPQLEPGEKAKVIHDERPSPNVQEQIRTLIRDIAEGWGLPLETVWEMVGMTGPAVRFVMDRADRWIKIRQKRHRIWGRRVWRYAIACGIANGRIGLPKEVKVGAEMRQKWWSVSFTAQRNLTIDRGQQSRSRLAELDSGVATLASFEDFDGKDWKERGKARIAEVAFLKEECERRGIPYELVFPPRPGAAAAPPASEGSTPKKGAEDDTDEENTE